MPVSLPIPVANPDELLNAGMFGAGAVIRVQTGAAEAGAFADVAGTGSTPTIPVVAATRAYTAYAPTGTAASWYRWRVENAGATRLGDWCAAYQGGQQYIVPVSSVRARIPGLTATDASRDAQLLEVMGIVTDEILSYTGRQLFPDPASGTRTVYLDHDGADSRTLWIPRGIRAVSYLGVSSTDQPDDGTGTYTQVTSGVYLDPPEQQRSRGWPATRITLGRTANALFRCAKRSVKLTAGLGWAATPPTVARISLDAILAMYGAQSTGSSSRLVTTPDGGNFRFLRYIPAEDRETLDWYRDVTAS